MKTRITLVTSETHNVDISVSKVIEKTTDEFGQIYNDYVKIKEDLWIAPAHIVKIERLNGKVESNEDDDAVVQY
ncbi:hypothetical protein GI584_14330 [Gracilibacillus salitolerans]|uniref:Uncharacterized protein n=1 Tax=Gracilibacillus salitolerans TaxID=2663022 RepID=A0A5Q2TJP1_9BACI|nr:hypothetical protein [Gracilibacillus salitolerans]QGH35149.1 hypothetical protein GI584_14330 [Gracilibacillus salitolerans]